MRDFDMPNDEASLEAPPNKLRSRFRKKQAGENPVVKNPMVQQKLSMDASNGTLEPGGFADRTGLNAKGKFPKSTGSFVANPMVASTSSPKDNPM